MLDHSPQMFFLLADFSLRILAIGDVFADALKDLPIANLHHAHTDRHVQNVALLRSHPCFVHVLAVAQHLRHASADVTRRFVGLVVGDPKRRELLTRVSQHLRSEIIEFHRQCRTRVDDDHRVGHVLEEMAKSDFRGFEAIFPNVADDPMELGIFLRIITSPRHRERCRQWRVTAARTQSRSKRALCPIDLQSRKFARKRVAILFVHELP